MKKLLSSALSLTALAATAFADTPMADIRTHAGHVQRGSEQVMLLLKAKQLDAQAIREKIASTGGNIENLQRLVTGMETANPQFLPLAGKDWDLLKLQVQLLSISHNNKHVLANADDVKKNRSLLQAQAKGVAQRAGLLEKTAERLQR